MASPSVVFIKTSRLFNVVCTIHNKCKSEKDLQKTLHFGDFNHKTNNILILALENTGRASLTDFTIYLDRKMLVITKFYVAFR